jgi:hypothetical protein
MDTLTIECPGTGPRLAEPPHEAIVTARDTLDLRVRGGVLTPGHLHALAGVGGMEFDA